MTYLQQETAFLPSARGFKFPNEFDASLKVAADDWRSFAALTALLLHQFTAPLVVLMAATVRIHHLCGGMSWAALDRYYGHNPSPLPEDTQPPKAGSPLFKELFSRQIDAIVANDGLITKCIDWTTRPDMGHPFDRHSIGHLTQAEEWPRVRDLIDRGIPASLGVITTRSVWHLCDNHEVVAWGYSLDETSKRVTLKIYDPNYPIRDDVTIGFTLGQSRSRLSARHSCGRTVRGFFLWPYDRSEFCIPRPSPARRRSSDEVLSWMLFEGVQAS